MALPAADLLREGLNLRIGHVKRAMRSYLGFAYPTLLFGYKLEAPTKFVFSDFLISLVA